MKLRRRHSLGGLGQGTLPVWPAATDDDAHPCCDQGAPISVRGSQCALRHFAGDGHEGGDASHRYQDVKLIGHVYSAPYALLEAGLVLVVAEGDAVHAALTPQEVRRFTSAGPV